MINLMSSTPVEIANQYDEHTIYRMVGYETGLDIDALANIIGNDDVSNMTGREIADNLEMAFCEWEEKPDCTPEELAADIVAYTAWQQLYKR